MIRQIILPFKLEIIKDLITSHAGLGLLGEFAVGLGLNKALDKYLPGPGSGAGYILRYILRPIETGHTEGVEVRLSGGPREKL